MTDSFLENAGGYTPVPDKLVREYGFETAYVWGKVWRYCQMQNGACTASHQTIADRAGMSRRTLIEKLNILIEAGYIEDKTPGLKNKPHTYCTKKGEAKIISTMQISHTESDNPTETHKDLGSESGVSMRTLHSDDADNAQSDPSTMQNLHSEDAGIAQPAESTMQNLHLKKDTSLESYPNKESLQDSSPNGEGGSPPPPIEDLPVIPEIQSEPERPPPKVEYTPFLRKFLAYFNAKRFRNPTQTETISGLVEKHGETEIEALAGWAAKKGMGLGQAIPAIESALKNPKNQKGQPTNGHYGNSTSKSTAYGTQSQKRTGEDSEGVISPERAAKLARLTR